MFFVVQIAVEQIAVLIQISNRIRRLQRILNVLFISPALRPAFEDSVAGSKNAGSCQTDDQSDDQPFDCRLSVSSVSSIFRKLADGISKKKISLEKTWDSISMFWHDGQNQKAFHLVWKRAKKLVRYVLPKKVQGRIHFGFDDPYDTGQVLTVVSPFYGLYARTLTLEPDFTGTALDGELHFKGRIALWYPLWTAARLFISKDFRRLLRFLRKRDSGMKKA